MEFQVAKSHKARIVLISLGYFSLGLTVLLGVADIASSKSDLASQIGFVFEVLGFEFVDFDLRIIFFLSELTRLVLPVLALIAMIAIYRGWRGWILAGAVGIIAQVLLHVAYYAASIIKGDSTFWDLVSHFPLVWAAISGGVFDEEGQISLGFILYNFHPLTLVVLVAIWMQLGKRPDSLKSVDSREAINELTCENCAAKVAIDANFCTSCASPIKGASQEI